MTLHNIYYIEDNSNVALSAEDLLIVPSADKQLTS